MSDKVRLLREGELSEWESLAGGEPFDVPSNDTGCCVDVTFDDIQGEEVRKLVSAARLARELVPLCREVVDSADNWLREDQLYSAVEKLRVLLAQVEDEPCPVERVVEQQEDAE